MHSYKDFHAQKNITEWVREKIKEEITEYYDLRVAFSEEFDTINYQILDEAIKAVHSELTRL